MGSGFCRLERRGSQLTYFVIDKDGASYGPATVEVLNQWIREGRVDASAQVDEVETGARIPITQVPNISFGSTSPPVQQNFNQYQQSSQHSSRESNYPRAGNWVQVENHLVKAILATVFCCMPVGIVSIVYAAQVDGHARRGDVNEAHRVADLADTWANWSIGLALIGGCLYFGFAMSIVGAGVAR